MIVTTEVSSDVIFVQQWFEFRYKIWSVAMDTSWQDWVMTSYYEVFRSEIQIRQSCQKKKCIFGIAFKRLSELSFIVTTGNATNVAQWKVLIISLRWNKEGLFIARLPFCESVKSVTHSAADFNELLLLT